MIWDILSSVALLLVCIACALHLNANVGPESAHCERLGFVLTMAGAFGQAVYPWWPKIEAFHFDAVLHIGMSLIALSLMRGHLRAFLISHGVTFMDRRRA